MACRPRRALTLVSPPEVEPVSLADAKAWVRVDGSDDDAQITSLIAAARAAVEEYLRRALVTQTWKLTLDLAPSGLASALGEGVYDLPSTALYGDLPQYIDLPKGPVQSVASVVTYDTTDASSTFDAANYRLDAAGSRLVLAYGATWPSGLRAQGACEVTYVAGYGDNASDVPQPLRTAILIYVATLYEQRGQCDDAMDLPPGSRQLLNQYRILGDRRG